MFSEKLYCIVFFKLIIYIEFSFLKMLHFHKCSYKQVNADKGNSINWHHNLVSAFIHVENFLLRFQIIIVLL